MRYLLIAAVMGLAALPFTARAQMAPNDPLAPAENAFAIDLYGKISQAQGNIFFSPYSIATALEVVYAGSAGSTADEIAHALHLNLLGEGDNGPELQKALLAAGQSQQRSMQYQGGGFTFKAVNALWGDKGYSFNPAFTANINTSFGCDLKPVNFKNPDKASAKINDWVAQQTNNKIQNLVSPELIKGDPPMVLTNAVYFNAVWKNEFDASATKKAKFHVSATRDVMADMMNMRAVDPRDWLSLTQADGVKVLSIPYGDYSTSMVIILPDDSQGLSAVQATLTADKLNGWLAKSQYVPVILSIPKFQVASQYDLPQALMSLGIKTAFDRHNADFSGIANDPSGPIYIGDVLHKAYIQVDEKGTEAAAATAVVMVASAGIEGPQPPPPPPVLFIADHPFIYLIRSSYSGDILFIGRVDDPTQ